MEELLCHAIGQLDLFFAAWMKVST
jgi:hypothetical protein